MQLIAGLGNIGDKYHNTRHNVGFMLVDSYAKKKGAQFKKYKECLGSIAHIKEDNQELLLLKPSTYMNLSGDSVLATLKYFNLPKSSMLVVYDDANHPLGYVRFRQFGGSGGHKGLKSIDRSFESQEYARIQIGIGRNEKLPLDVYVLSPFTNEEVEELIMKEETIHQMFDEWSKGAINV